MQVSSTLLVQPIKKKRSPTPTLRSIQADRNSLEDDVASTFAKYYAVAVGRKPGIYEDWAGKRGAEKETNGVSGALYQRFNDRKLAIAFMCRGGVAREDIRFFKAHFAKRADFKPNPSAPFFDEYTRFVATQSYTKPRQRRAGKVEAIRDEIISYFLPGGVPIDQVDDDGKIHLNPDQTLSIYQKMCKFAGKHIEVTIRESLLSLKNRPRINIIDLIDSCRADRKPLRFTDWFDFKDSTLMEGK
jgi:hypothetical protein